LATDVFGEQHTSLIKNVTGKRGDAEPDFERFKWSTSGQTRGQSGTVFAPSEGVGTPMLFLVHSWAACTEWLWWCAIREHISPDPGLFVGTVALGIATIVLVARTNAVARLTGLVAKATNDLAEATNTLARRALDANDLADRHHRQSMSPLVYVDLEVTLSSGADGFHVAVSGRYVNVGPGPAQNVTMRVTSILKDYSHVGFSEALPPIGPNQEQPISFSWSSSHPRYTGEAMTMGYKATLNATNIFGESRETLMENRPGRKGFGIVRFPVL
jgi:hypothetical protein